jgi:hypothetical protein
MVGVGAGVGHGEDEEREQPCAGGHDPAPQQVADDDEEDAAHGADHRQRARRLRGRDVGGRPVGPGQAAPHLPLEGGLGDGDERLADGFVVLALDGAGQPTEVAGHDRPGCGGEVRDPEVDKGLADLADEVLGQRLGHRQNSCCW